MCGVSDLGLLLVRDAHNGLDLCILGVDPAYQGRGVGKMLVQWGIEQAKAQGKGIFLTATPVGKPFYKRMGLHDAGAFEIWGTPQTSFVLPS